MDISLAKERATDAAVLGYGWWLVIHTFARLADTYGKSEGGDKLQLAFFFLVEFTKTYFKALDCQSHFVEFEQAHDPSLYRSLFRWTVDAHNEVNARNNRPILTMKEAATEMNRKRNQQDFVRSGPGCWAVLHQTALYLKNHSKETLMVPKKSKNSRESSHISGASSHISGASSQINDRSIIEFIHSIISKQPEFGTFYVFPRNNNTKKLFEWTVAQHTRVGGLDITVDEAEEIWGEDNVKHTPCSGPTQNLDEEEEIYDISDEEESSEEEFNTKRQQSPTAYREPSSSDNDLFGFGNFVSNLFFYPRK
jgi:hypothetical protein